MSFVKPEVKILVPLFDVNAVVETLLTRVLEKHLNF